MGCFEDDYSYLEGNGNVIFSGWFIGKETMFMFLSMNEKEQQQQ